MQRSTLISHTADIRLKAEGDSLEALFNASLEGMASIIAPDACLNSLTESKTISLAAPDITALLIDFLSTVLTKTQITKTIFCRADFKQLTNTNLVATIHGCKTDSFSEDIKAVTYHEANVEQKDTIWQTMVVFDI